MYFVALPHKCWQWTRTIWLMTYKIKICSSYKRELPRFKSWLRGNNPQFTPRVEQSWVKGYLNLYTTPQTWFILSSSSFSKQWWKRGPWTAVGSHHTVISIGDLPASSLGLLCSMYTGFLAVLITHQTAPLQGLYSFYLWHYSPRHHDIT